MPKTAQSGKKRPHLYGRGVSVYFKEDQNRWMCSVRLDDGRRKYIAGSVGALYEEVEGKFRQGIEEIRKGTRLDPSSQTLADYIISWLEEKKPALKKGTYPKWKNHIEVHVIPDLGTFKLQKLERGHIQNWVGKLIKKGLAASTIRLYHRILGLAFKDAVKRRILMKNPCEDVTLPRIEEEEMLFLDLKQARLLLAFLKENKHPHEALFALAMTTGMRRGELQALRREDIDFDEGVIRVRRTVVHIPEQGYHENEPKSKGSRRMIPLTSETLEILRTYCESQGETTGLVFRGRHGSYFSPRGIGWVWGRVLKEAGLPQIRFHDLRHTAATLLLRAGASLNSVKKILGHSDIATTMRYVHLLPEMLEEDIKRLSTLLAA